jgi:hypothetical protein
VSSLAFRIALPLYLIEIARASGRRYLAYREGHFKNYLPSAILRSWLETQSA